MRPTALASTTLFCLLLAGVASAQFPLPKVPDVSKPKTGDPLGRETPRGSILGFLDAFHRGSYATAAQYLQLEPRERERRGAELARKFGHVVDLSFRGDLDEISRLPEGSLNDGVDLELVGKLRLSDGTVEVTLSRVAESGAAPIWLVSSDIVRRIPDLYERVGYGDFEQNLPAWMVEKRILGVPVWIWIAVTVLFVIFFLVALILVTIIFWLYRRFWSKTQVGWTSWRREALPFVVLLTLGLHATAVTNLRGLPIFYRQYYNRFISILTIAVIAWAIFRLIDYATRRLGTLMTEHGQTSGSALLLLGRRVLKALVIGLALLATLQALGYNTAPLLAGLGIGGVALALASQKTIENIFGGLSVLGDSSVRVGDFCKVGTVAGSIEDIGLRATRLRTIDRSVVSIPNSSLYTSNVENLGLRDKILFRHFIGLRYETTADQMRYVLATTRQLLIEHPKVETETCRVRLQKFNASSIDFEVWAYVLTMDFNEFLAIQEDLLLRLMDIVAESGTTIAFPSQTLYVRTDDGLDDQRRASAEDVVREWREKKELPFPDFPPGKISESRNRLPYPPPESAVSATADGEDANRQALNP